MIDFCMEIIMKYFIPEPIYRPTIDADFNVSIESLASVESFETFFKKLVFKIGAFFGNHAAMRKYIEQNMKLFDDLNKDAIVNTVLAKDLSAVGNAIENINEGLEKLRLGGKLEMHEFVDDALEKVGIEYERGRLSTVKFQSGNWGDGKDKTGLDHPMTYRKTIEEHGWLNGAKTYAERFLKLAETTSKDKLIAASNRHYADVKKAMARGVGRQQAVFEKQVAIDQINQINSARDMLIKFYFKQLCNIMKGANIQPIGKIPQQQEVIPNNWTGQ